ncbi:hypothetical protein FRB95_013122 [Tulasnella sp. JGI-2019a]|nr:hypothetical protein FRB95_013122 [Tulasnella sp. JGI-2019a]
MSTQVTPPPDSSFLYPGDRRYKDYMTMASEHRQAPFGHRWIFLPSWEDLLGTAVSGKPQAIYLIALALADAPEGALTFQEIVASITFKTSHLTQKPFSSSNISHVLSRCKAFTKLSPPRGSTAPRWYQSRRDLLLPPDSHPIFTLASSGSNEVTGQPIDTPSLPDQGTGPAPLFAQPVTPSASSPRGGKRRRSGGGGVQNVDPTQQSVPDPIVPTVPNAFTQSNAYTGEPSSSELEDDKKELKRGKKRKVSKERQVTNIQTSSAGVSLSPPYHTPSTTVTGLPSCEAPSLSFEDTAVTAGPAFRKPLSQERYAHHHSPDMALTKNQYFAGVQLSNTDTCRASHAQSNTPTSSLSGDMQPAASTWPLPRVNADPTRQGSYHSPSVAATIVQWTDSRFDISPCPTSPQGSSDIPDPFVEDPYDSIARIFYGGMPGPPYEPASALFDSTGSNQQMLGSTILDWDSFSSQEGEYPALEFRMSIPMGFVGQLPSLAMAAHQRWQNSVKASSSTCDVPGVCPSLDSTPLDEFAHCNSDDPYTYCDSPEFQRQLQEAGLI